jgi:hypothetical protein
MKVTSTTNILQGFTLNLVLKMKLHFPPKRLIKHTILHRKQKTRLSSEQYPPWNSANLRRPRVSPIKYRQVCSCVESLTHLCVSCKVCIQWLMPFSKQSIQFAYTVITRTHTATMFSCTDCIKTMKVRPTIMRATNPSHFFTRVYRTAMHADSTWTLFGREGSKSWPPRSPDLINAGC